jgi:hypothetical protein
MTKKWFKTRFLNAADVTIDLSAKDAEVHRKMDEGGALLLWKPARKR